MLGFIIMRRSFGMRTSKTLLRIRLTNCTCLELHLATRLLASKWPKCIVVTTQLLIA